MLLIVIGKYFTKTIYILIRLTIDYSENAVKLKWAGTKLSLISNIGFVRSWWVLQQNKWSQYQQHGAYLVGSQKETFF